MELKNECPHCHSELDSNTDPTGKEVPQEGDVTVCLYCQNILMFGKNLTYRLPTEEELTELKEDEGTWDTIQRLRFEIKETLPPELWKI